ncbi:MAG TPA: Mut7-C RNAse domain-containing protein [Actinomycetota bacterium]|nr:Mut7-C RNAse domain-containing protein [Actinomycetota bacterium]
MDRSVEVRIYAELNDFLPPDRRFVTFRQPLGLRQTVKDLIEATGIPHTEVDAVIANGTSVGFDHRPSHDDLIGVYPVFESIDIRPILRLRPEPLRDTRFVVDSNLGGLARLLRRLGFDAVFRNDFADDEIARISASEKRVLLTRDVELLKRRNITHGYYVRTIVPVDQAAEVVRRFDLVGSVHPLSRCLECNVALEAVTAEEVMELLPEAPLREHISFSRCRVCGRVYWPGSHYSQMKRKVDEILQRAQDG